MHLGLFRRRRVGRDSERPIQEDFVAALKFHGVQVRTDHEVLRFHLGEEAGDRRVESSRAEIIDFETPRLAHVIRGPVAQLIGSEQANEVIGVRAAEREAETELQEFGGLPSEFPGRSRPISFEIELTMSVTTSSGSTSNS